MSEEKEKKHRYGLPIEEVLPATSQSLGQVFDRRGIEGAAEFVSELVAQRSDLKELSGSWGSLGYAHVRTYPEVVAALAESVACLGIAYCPAGHPSADPPPAPRDPEQVVATFASQGRTGALLSWTGADGGGLSLVLSDVAEGDDFSGEALVRAASLAAACLLEGATVQRVPLGGRDRSLPHLDVGAVEALAEDGWDLEEVARSPWLAGVKGTAVSHVDRLDGSVVTSLYTGAVSRAKLDELAAASDRESRQYRPASASWLLDPPELDLDGTPAPAWGSPGWGAVVSVARPGYVPLRALSPFWQAGSRASAPERGAAGETHAVLLVQHADQGLRLVHLDCPPLVGGDASLLRLVSGLRPDSAVWVVAALAATGNPRNSSPVPMPEGGDALLESFGSAGIRNCHFLVGDGEEPGTALLWSKDFVGWKAVLSSRLVDTVTALVRQTDGRLLRGIRLTAVFPAGGPDVPGPSVTEVVETMELASRGTLYSPAEVLGAVSLQQSGFPATKPGVHLRVVPPHGRGDAFRAELTGHLPENLASLVTSMIGGLPEGYLLEARRADIELSNLRSVADALGLARTKNRLGLLAFLRASGRPERGEGPW